MIILDATTKSLQVKLSATVATNQLPFSTSYIDTTGTVMTPGEQDGTSNNTTAVTVASAPASSTERLIKSFIIQNADTAPATVTIIYNNNSTPRNVIVAILAVGDQLIYEDGRSWVCIDTNGNTKTTIVSSVVSSVSNSDGTLTISPTAGNVVASLASLASGKFLVGNGSNIATGLSMSGDATLANTGAVTIANNAVTNAKAAQMAANTIKGNNTGSTANAADLTVSQVQTMLGIGSSVIYNSIAGLLPTSITGTHTTASITITAGQAADSTNAAMLSGGSFSWAVSNGNAINGYQGGSTLPNSSTIHFFICNGGSGTGTFASTSLTPTLPTGYSTYYRRIFSLKTNSSGALLGGTAIEAEGGSLIFWLATPVQDINTGLGTTRTALTLGSIPTGVKFMPIVIAMASSQNDSVWLSGPDEPDTAPTGVNSATSPGYTLGVPTSGLLPYVPFYFTTNTSAQIEARSNSANPLLNLTTRGWKDFRRV